jgi:hypothetical protein
MYSAAAVTPPPHSLPLPSLPAASPYAMHPNALSKCSAYSHPLLPSAPCRRRRPPPPPPLPPLPAVAAAAALSLSPPPPPPPPTPPPFPPLPSSPPSHSPPPSPSSTFHPNSARGLRILFFVYTGEFKFFQYPSALNSVARISSLMLFLWCCFIQSLVQPTNKTNSKF